MILLYFASKSPSVLFTGVCFMNGDTVHYHVMKLLLGSFLREEFCEVCCSFFCCCSFIHLYPSSNTTQKVHNPSCCSGQPIYSWRLGKSSMMSRANNSCQPFSHFPGKHPSSSGHSCKQYTFKLVKAGLPGLLNLSWDSRR